MAVEEIKRKNKFDGQEEVDLYRDEKKGNPKNQRSETLKTVALDAMYTIASLKMLGDLEEFDKEMERLSLTQRNRVLEIIASQAEMSQ